LIIDAYAEWHGGVNREVTHTGDEQGQDEKVYVRYHPKHNRPAKQEIR
jgi:hypothetical protein